MTDFYTELNLDKNKSLDEISSDLSRLESTWKRREITNPEKATTMLALIIQARKVFASEASRREYDRNLAKSKEKPTVSDPNASRNQQFKKWYDDAFSYYDSNQYDLAKTALERALSYYSSDSDDGEFLCLAAAVYKENRNYSVALDYINKAIVISPQNAQYYIAKGRILAGQASSVQVYDYNSEAEKERLMQNARDVSNQAAIIAHRQGDKSAESEAYGALAIYHYFVRFPDRSKAEEYAKKSVELGDARGEGSKVLNNIEQEDRLAEEEKRTKEQREREERERREQAERERARAEQERLQKEKRAKELKEKEERERREREERERARAERERKQKEKRDTMLNAFFVICRIAFFVWCGLAVYSMIKNRNNINVELKTLLFFIITAANIIFSEIVGGETGDFMWMAAIAFGIYLIIAGTIKFNHLGFGASQEATVIYAVKNALIFIGVIVVSVVIGKAVSKRME